MASCDMCHDGKVMSKHGLKIHMGKIHNVHYGMTVPNTQTPVVEPTKQLASVYLPNPSTEPENKSDSIRGERGAVSDLVPCGHPFCKVRLPRAELRGHWAADHPTWVLHTGLYVWESQVAERDMTAIESLVSL